MSQENIEEQGVTLGQIFGVIIHNKLRLLITTLICFVIICLVGVLGYNRNANTYTIKYNYDDGFLENGIYGDGSTFDLSDIYYYLEPVKLSSSDYNNINVEKMIKNDDISVVKTVVTNDADEVTDEFYEISVKSKYFDSKEQANSFLTDVINYGVIYSISLVEYSDLKINLNSAKESTTYELEIEYLQKQSDLLISLYSSLIETYGDLAYEDESGTKVKLSTRIEQINLYLKNDKLSTMLIEVEENGYIKDYTSNQYYYSSLKYELEQEKKYNDAKLKELTEQRSNLIKDATEGGTLQSLDLSTYNDQIISLTVRNVDIEKELAIIEKHLEDNTNETSQSKNEFDERLTACYDKIESFTNEYIYYNDKCINDYKIVYKTAAKMEESGGFSIIIIGLLGAIIGVCAGACVNLVLDRERFKLNKENNN